MRQRLSLLLTLLAASSATFCQGPPPTPDISFTPNAPLILPAGTSLQLAVTRAVWTARARPGDTLYTQTVFPVSLGQNMAIPAGSYVEGRIDAVTLPTRWHDHAQFHLRLTRIILASGYVAPLADTAALVTVQVSRASDILLDNGTQVEMTLGAPLTLDPAQVKTAIALTRAPKPGEFTHATLCRPTPGTTGTPGSSGTVIPGTPASPPTVIPGGPGMPPTVIPGSPGTPDQVVGATSGTPGTPGTICPLPPLVISVTPDSVTPDAPKLEVTVKK